MSKQNTEKKDSGLERFLMNVADNAEAALREYWQAPGVVELCITGLHFCVVGNAVCRTWESGTFAFPCAVNGVIHDAIASYAHFHDAKPLSLCLFSYPRHYCGRSPRRVTYSLWHFLIQQ